MATLSGTMDAPLTELMRAAALLAGYPELRGAQERIVTAAQVLEAVRLGVAQMERLAMQPEPAAISPCAVVRLDDFRTLRGDPAVRP